MPKTNNYLVLTPSYDTLEEYNKQNINCKVIQKYTIPDKIPEEENIIVDEIGMIDGKAWDFLYKCKILNKNIWGFGDFNQLEPPEKGNNTTYNNPIFLKLLFNNHHNIETNYRNNFSKEYYDELINSKDKQFLIKEVKKYNTDWKKADKNTTRHIYNNKLLKLKGFHNIKVNEKNGNIEGKLKKGLKLICINNELHKHNIYNKRVLEIVKIENENIHLEDNIILKDEEIRKNFNVAYCRTLYSLQGKSLFSMCYAMEDMKFINNRSAYTFISRLKL